MQTDPHRLLVLRAVRRTGSIRAAAAALHLTASGVSQHLTRLEAETGLRLIDRSRRGGGRTVTLTSAGLALAERADAVSAALAEAQREADRLRDGSAGTVRVGAFATALARLVVPVLSRLSVGDPGVQCQVVEVTLSDGLPQLLAGELDLLVSDRRYGVAAAHPGLVEHDLCADRYRIVVPRLWPATSTLDELLAGPWVTSPPGQPSRRILDELCRAHGVRTGVRHLCTESRTMMALVSAGLGAAIVPLLTLADLATPEVTAHPGEFDGGSRMLTVIGPEDDHTPPAVARFRALLLQVAREQG